MISWAHDIEDMHEYYGHKEAVQALPADKLKAFLLFRANFIKEEYEEMWESIETRNPEEFVDALIDMCVVAIGTLDLLNVDAQEAWTRVFEANMAKTSGVNPNRPNEFGLPDLIKPEGWTAPSHKGNHGRLPEALL